MPSWACWGTPVMAAVLIFPLGSLVHRPSMLFALPVGLGTFVIYLLVLKSLVEGEVSTNITIFRLNFVVSSVLAVFLLGEILTVRKIIGLILCTAAIVTLFLSAPRQIRGSRSGLRFSIPACLLAGGLNILVKTAFNNGALVVQLILYRYLVVAVIAGLFNLLNPGQRERGDRRIYLFALLSAAAMMFALSFTFAALQIGDVALVIPIIQLAFVFSSAGAVLVFKERLSIPKVLAIALAVGSITIIA
jgi:uncharacterized membrane protein